MLRRLLKRLRAQPSINHAVTATAKALRFRGEWAASHLPRQGHVSVRMPDGPDIRLWSNADDWSTSRLWWHGYRAMESETIDLWRRLAGRSRTVLDVGAHVGWYALLAAQAGAGRVFAFEPHPRIAVRCAMNVSLNPWPITVIPYAATSSTGPVDFHIGGPGLPSSSGIDALAGSYEQVRVGGLRVDDFCTGWGLDTVDLVKIDVEGHEPEALRGMSDTLERSHPALIFEMIAEATTGPAIASILGPLGYRYFQLTATGPVERSAPTAPGDRYCNYLAIVGEPPP